MNRCIRGNTYLIQIGVFWYIVQQTGMKTWDGVVFTHNTPMPNKDFYVHGNAITILQKLREINNGSIDDYVVANNKKELREAMFNILKTGSPQGEL